MEWLHKLDAFLSVISIMRISLLEISMEWLHKLDAFLSVISIMRISLLEISMEWLHKVDAFTTSYKNSTYVINVT